MQLRQRWQLAGELARFCIVGLLSVALNNLIIVALTELLGFHYLTSIFLCFLLATLMGFVLNRSWSFRKRSAVRHVEVARYFTVTILGLFLGLFASWYFTGYGIPYYVTMIVVGILMAPLNFLAHRLWSFGLRLGLMRQEPA